MGVVSVPPVAPRMPGKAIWGGAARNFQFSHGLDPFKTFVFGNMTVTDIR
jgi:hypothetical protein